MTVREISGETIAKNDAALRALDAELDSLQPDELAVLRELQIDWGFYLPRLAVESGITVEQVRRARLALRDRGLARIEAAFSDDDGLLRGSVYLLTRRGEQLQAREEWRREQLEFEQAGPRVEPSLTSEGAPVSGQSR